MLIGVYRLTKRQVPELMRDLFGLQMSVGAVIGCQEAASAAIAQTVEDARSYAQQQPGKYADETGWREGAGRARAWLWTARHHACRRLHDPHAAQRRGRQGVAR